MLDLFWRSAASCTLLFGMTLFVAPAFAAKPVNTNLAGAAVEGTDVVAYFTQGKPVKGSTEFTYEWNGAMWQFASAEHRALFAQDPETYAPQYGGYCAYAVAQGATAGIDPTAWTIHEGKLYLNLSPGTQERWKKNSAGFINKADVNWPKLVSD